MDQKGRRKGKQTSDAKNNGHGYQQEDKKGDEKGNQKRHEQQLPIYIDYFYSKVMFVGPAWATNSLDLKALWSEKDNEKGFEKRDKKETNKDTQIKTERGTQMEIK